jgi:ABC-type transport system involved in cytochrome bd biosynthesis fused ATPase/permease subunit
VINQLRGKTTILFIAHAPPKNLQVDEIVRIGAGTLSAVGGMPEGRRQEVEGGAIGREKKRAEAEMR